MTLKPRSASLVRMMQGETQMQWNVLLLGGRGPPRLPSLGQQDQRGVRLTD